jgi:hypothetical protein
MIVDDVQVLDSAMLSLLCDNSFDCDGVVPAQVGKRVLNYTLFLLLFYDERTSMERLYSIFMCLDENEKEQSGS